MPLNIQRRGGRLSFLSINLITEITAGKIHGDRLRSAISHGLVDRDGTSGAARRGGLLADAWNF